MRAYRFEQPNSAVTPDELARRGILSWAVPEDESERSALIASVCAQHGYVDQDFIELKPDTPNLDAICAKFDREHYHTEDEVRFVVEGEGIFDIRDDADEWVRIEVTPGDMIVIPARTYHRFYLTDRKHIRCMRLFANHDGWSPLYREA
jgi:1,2-dihydroxy-3-keto-5-methylthiopentene dioxygenase